MSLEQHPCGKPKRRDLSACASLRSEAQLGTPHVLTVREQQNIAESVLRSVSDGHRDQPLVAGAVQSPASAGHNVLLIYVTVLISRDDCCHFRRLRSIVSAHVYRPWSSVCMNEQLIRPGMLVGVRSPTQSSKTLHASAHLA